MKGMFRLALSAYVLVVGTSARALGMQENAVVSTRVSMIDAAMFVRPALTPAPSADRSVAPARVRLPYASSAAAETLAIAVHGPSQVRTASTAGFRATVGNGMSDSHFYFWWFAANCARRVGCTPSSYALVAEGAGRDSVALALAGNSAERDLVVQVAELDGAHRTGSSPMFVVAGPAQGAHGIGEAAPRPSCDWFAGSFYPHTANYTDPYTGHSWPRTFRRDYCGNRVQWNPEG
jgi:hypothetical protein